MANQFKLKFLFLSFLVLGTANGFCQETSPAKEESQPSVEKTTQDNLTQLIQDIEAYKKSHGQYPSSLADLVETGTKADKISDVIAVPGHTKDAEPYVYQVIRGGQTYLLFSRGPDGTAFSSDDILPAVDLKENPGFGYRPRQILNEVKVPPTATPTPAPPYEMDWRTPDQALAESEKTGKPILYDFCAAWCGPCRKLAAEVLDNSAYAPGIEKGFIPCRVVDRKYEEGHNPSSIAQLQKKYRITGFPTLVVQFPKEKKFQDFVGYYGREGTLDLLQKALVEK